MSNKEEEFYEKPLLFTKELEFSFNQTPKHIQEGDDKTNYFKNLALTHSIEVLLKVSPILFNSFYLPEAYDFNCKSTHLRFGFTQDNEDYYTEFKDNTIYKKELKTILKDLNNIYIPNSRIKDNSNQLHQITKIAVKTVKNNKIKITLMKTKNITNYLLILELNIYKNPKSQKEGNKIMNKIISNNFEPEQDNHKLIV